MHELAIAERREPRAGAEPPASPYVAASGHVRHGSLAACDVSRSPENTVHVGRSPHGDCPGRVLPIFLAAPTRFFVKAGDPQGLGQSSEASSSRSSPDVAWPPPWRLGRHLTVPQVSQCRVRGRGVEQPWGTGRGPCRVVRRC